LLYIIIPEENILENIKYKKIYRIIFDENIITNQIDHYNIFILLNEKQFTIGEKIN